MAQAKKKTRARKASKKKGSKKKAARSGSRGKASRAERMAKLRADGWTYEKIAEKFSLTRQRVYQVLNEEGQTRPKQEPGQPKAELLRGRGIQAKLEQYNNPQEMGDRIVWKRMKLGKTIQELSEISGIPHGVLSTYENNRAKPSCDNLMKLSVALRVSAHWLLFGHSFKKPQPA